MAPSRRYSCSYSPMHDRPTPKPIPLNHTGVDKTFPTKSVDTTSPICTKQSKSRLITEEYTSPLPHEKCPRSMCIQPCHATPTSLTSKWQTNIRTMCSQTDLSQSITNSSCMNRAVVSFQKTSYFRTLRFFFLSVYKEIKPMITFKAVLKCSNRHFLLLVIFRIQL